MNVAEQLLAIFPQERVKTRLIDVLSYAADAGFYYLVPIAVVQPVNEAEIIALFDLSAELGIPVVFRTGGTSLSGQSITDGVLVDLSQHWNSVKVSDDGRLVTCQPGITGAMVNAHLKKYQRKIGPDPSSINAAMMGGILSNNASGMCCGVTLNAYHTVRNIRLVLPNGKAFYTGLETDYERFRMECPEIFQAFAAIQQQILHDQQLYERIRQKYCTKNTVGYSLNAFVDYVHPLDILAHLLIGGEGTLAFIAEASLETVPDHPYKATALLTFENIYAACAVIEHLSEAGAAMVELMDRASLYAIDNLEGIDPFIKQLPGTAAALLVEFQECSGVELNARVDKFLAGIGDYQLCNAPVFTNDARERDLLWKMRKGLFPSVGAIRARGTTVVLEDIGFPIHVLGEAIFDLQQLFRKYKYDNAIIFGHAKDGNIHFVITQSFQEQADINRYDLFMQEVVALVVGKYDGTLKAEHGTGRNMAPFVEAEWHGPAYAIMQHIKSVVDPKNLLNPGVIINSDKQVHIRNLKRMPEIEAEVDKCIECGFCEPVCPSRNVTLTPRRRIMVRRELKKLQEAGKDLEYATLLAQYTYDGLETCAVDGLCATACPVDINTGDLVKRLRKENHSGFANRMALFMARQFSMMERMVRCVLHAGHFLNTVTGKGTMSLLTKLGHQLIPAIPLWTEHLGKPPDVHFEKKTPQHMRISDTLAFIYFPTCISRVMGNGIEGKANIMTTFLQVSDKAGVHVRVFEGVMGSCCGQIFSSKGFRAAHEFTANTIIEKLWAASDEGRDAVIMDVSSCTYTLKNIRHALHTNNQVKFDQMTFLDSIDFLHDHILPKCPARQKKENVALHPVCSVQKMGIQNKLYAVAAHFARQVTLPKAAGCCGMAGDRGFFFPELTASATKEEADEVIENDFDGYYSSTRTCEMALSEAVGRNYESILYLVNECI